MAGLTIPGRTVLGVTMLGTSIRGASLPSRKVAKDITAVEDETTVAYEASESVLFDYCLLYTSRCV